MSARYLAAMWLLAVVPGSAASFDYWNLVDAEIVSLERLSVSLTAQFRTDLTQRDFYQVRLGPYFRYSLSEGVTALAGYYFREQEIDVNDWGNSHRTFAGVQYPLGKNRLGLTARSMVEHHFGGWAAPQVVFRQQYRISHGEQTVRYAGGETFFDQRGYLQQRLTAGIRLSLGHGATTDVYYQVDVRRASAGPVRHVLATTFRFGSPLRIARRR